MLEDNVWLGTMMLALDEVDGLRQRRRALDRQHDSPGVPDHQDQAGREHRLVGILHVLAGSGGRLRRLRGEPRSRRARCSPTSRSRAPTRPRASASSRASRCSATRPATRARARTSTKCARPRGWPAPAALSCCSMGPMQYDAAENSDVAKAKAPNSPVAGRATVFIFPDLNTGNTTYKAVQRSANVVSVGPDAARAEQARQRSLARRTGRRHRVHDRADGHSDPRLTCRLGLSDRFEERGAGALVRVLGGDPSARARDCGDANLVEHT